MGATWVYGSGNSLTFPQAVYIGIPEQGWENTMSADIVESYGERNSNRMPAYHRLDVAINKHKEREKWKSILSIGVYNLYIRKNPFFAYLDYQNNTRVAKQVSLYPIIPSISYRIQIF